MAIKYSITPDMKVVLDFVAAYLQETGCSPSFRDISEATNKSLGNVSQIIRRLEERGHITRLRRQERSITLLPDAARPAA